MKRLALLCSFSIAISTASAVPISDPFADATNSGGTPYSVGEKLVGQSSTSILAPWYARGTNFGTTQPTIVAGNLSYPGLKSSTGNSVAFVPAKAVSACIDLNLPSGHTQTVYYSFVLKITDIAAVTAEPTNNPFAAFIDDPSLSFTANQIGRLGSRIVTKKVGEGYVLGTSKSANVADFVYEPETAAHAMNDTLFVVACYQRVPNVQTNVQMWINPPISSFESNQPPPATLIATAGTTALNTNSARGFAILCQYQGAPGGVLDELRVSTNWSEVTPADRLVSVSKNGSDVVLSWAGAYQLQFATNVSGPYRDVTGSSSPHTLNTLSTNQLFFRLKK